MWVNRLESNNFICIAATVAALGLNAGHAQAGRVAYATTTDNALVQFDTDDPGTIQSSVAVTGLADDEDVLGIDFRPADSGVLFALGSSNRLYTINRTNGAATAVGGPFSPALVSNSYGFDFNPVIDRIRVVGDTDDQNLVINPNDGAASGPPAVVPVFYGAGDVNAGADPNVVHSAYTNNINGAATTTLHGIDTGLDILVTQQASAGVLTTVGNLGIDVGELGGFDIVGAGEALAALGPDEPGEPSSLYRINLTTGEATLIGGIGAATLTSLAVGDDVTAIPLPAAVYAFPLVVGIAGWAGRRMRRAT